MSYVSHYYLTIGTRHSITCLTCLNTYCIGGAKIQAYISVYCIFTLFLFFLVFSLSAILTSPFFFPSLFYLVGRILFSIKLSSFICLLCFYTSFVFFLVCNAHPPPFFLSSLFYLLGGVFIVQLKRKLDIIKE